MCKKPLCLNLAAMEMQAKNQKEAIICTPIIKNVLYSDHYTSFIAMLCLLHNVADK